MLTFLRTDSSHPDFVALVQLLDADLRVRDGEDHAFYAQFNKIDQIKNVVVGYRENVAVGCGAFKPFAPGTGEVKRMYVLPAYRNQGIAGAILQELETWAASLDLKTLVLETGVAQPEAIALYNKHGYARIPNYGQYANVENSVCLQKSVVERG